MKIISNAVHLCHIPLSHRLLVIMKLSLTLNLCFVFCASAVNSYSQEITTGAKIETMKEVFDIVKQKSDYTFWYRSEDVTLDQKVKVNPATGSVMDMLDSALAEQ